MRNVVIMKGFQPPKGYTVRGKETMLAFQRNPKAASGQDPWPAVAFRESRALWRDSLALMQSTDNESEQPKTLKWLSDLASEDIIPQSDIVPVDIFGLKSDRAKIEFWRHERLPLPLVYLKDKQLSDSLREALELTEMVARDMQGAIWYMAKDLLKIDEPNPKAAQKQSIRDLLNHLGAEEAYWSRLGGPFKQLVVDLSRDKDEYGLYGSRQLPKWKKTLHDTLWAAFTEATRGMEHSTRTLKAMAVAEQSLGRRTREYLTTLEEETKNDTGVRAE